MQFPIAHDERAPHGRHHDFAASMPGITREMIVTIQALVILFTGAMGDMLRIPLARLFSLGRKPEAGGHG